MAINWTPRNIRCQYCSRPLDPATALKPYHAPLYYCDHNHRLLHWNNMDPAKRHRISLAMHIPIKPEDIRHGG